MLLELKKCGRKGVGKGQRRVLVKTKVCGGPHRSIWRGRHSGLCQFCGKTQYLHKLQQQVVELADN